VGRTSGQSAAARQALLALLLTAVLAAAAGAAWLLQEIAQRRVDKAAAILKQIRSSKLSLYWPDRRQTDWYLIQQGTTVLGWRAIVREGSGGGFRGWEVEFRHSQSGAVEHEIYSAWKLNADATDGNYESRVQRPGQPTQLTRIRLQEPASEADQATVEVIQPNFGKKAQSPEPRNYIPEGVLRLAIRLVAEGGADAQFKMVFDDIPNTHKVVEFGSVRISHEGRGRTGEGKPIHRVRAHYRGWGKHCWEYELDESGKVISIIAGNVRWVAASAADMTKRFPNAPETVRGFARPRPDAQEQTPRRRGLFSFF